MALFGSKAIIHQAAGAHLPKEGFGLQESDAWTGGRMDGRTDGQKDGRTEGRTDGRTDGRERS